MTKHDSSSSAIYPAIRAHVHVWWANSPPPPPPCSVQFWIVMCTSPPPPCSIQSVLNCHVHPPPHAVSSQFWIVMCTPPPPPICSVQSVLNCHVQCTVGKTRDCLNLNMNTKPTAISEAPDDSSMGKESWTCRLSSKLGLGAIHF